jgi:hypothetical protein
MNGPRVDVKRLLRVLFFSTVLPLSAMTLFDYYSGLWPVLTLFSLVIILPIGTFLTSHAALDEMNKVIAEVAPLESDDIDDRSDTSL